MKHGYGRVPDEPTPKGQWLKVSIDIQVDSHDVDWDKFDGRTLARQLGYLLGLAVTKTTQGGEDKTASVFVKNLNIEEIEFIPDEVIENFFKDQE